MIRALTSMHPLERLTRSATILASAASLTICACGSTPTEDEEAFVRVERTEDGEMIVYSDTNADGRP
ncbi:MAG: hypothetical protein KC561_02420, partial [Myxococcales bacterium]|nr:hypothetical protein [Myxococcales bacterium]